MLLNGSVGFVYRLKRAGLFADVGVARLAASDAAPETRWMMPMTLGVRVPLR